MSGIFCMVQGGSVLFLIVWKRVFSPTLKVSNVKLPQINHFVTGKKYEIWRTQILILVFMTGGKECIIPNVF